MSDKKRKRSTSSDGSQSSEPIAKRTRSVQKQRMEIPEPVQSKVIDSERSATILDILNEDCWRVLLDYVSVPEIVRSERISRRWQCVVHRYLRGVRLCVRATHYFYPKPANPLVKCRILNSRPAQYLNVIKKFGPAIVASDCLHEGGLRALGKHCPELEELRVSEAQYHSLKNRAVHFSKLKQVSFDRVIRFKDAHITKLIGFTTLEQLKINDNQMMTGFCLNELKANLKALNLSSCPHLDIAHILTAAPRLADLTKLEFNCNSTPILQTVYKLIEKTPNLEFLGLEWYGNTKVGGLVEAICSLARLNHLRLNNNLSVGDGWLEAVGARCGVLRTLDVGGCRVSAAGVLAVCRGAGKTLVTLGVSYNRDLADDDVARCIAYCPKLELMDLTCCGGVSRALPARVAPRPCPRTDTGTRTGTRTDTRTRTRARPLRLQLWNTMISFAQDLYPAETYPDLILDFDI